MPSATAEDISVVVDSKVWEVLREDLVQALILRHQLCFIYEGGNASEVYTKEGKLFCVQYVADGTLTVSLVANREQAA